MKKQGDILFQAKLIGRAGIKKNGKKIRFQRGKIFVSTSDNYKNWERNATLWLMQEKARTLTPMPITTPINLECKFYFQNHKWEQDLSNAYQGIEDLLQTVGIIENDKLIYSHDGSKKIFDASEVFVEIKITHHIEENACNRFQANSIV